MRNRCAACGRSSREVGKLTAAESKTGRHRPSKLVFCKDCKRGGM